jgi:glycosyltransferase involved in cell wall biosynthesis
MRDNRYLLAIPVFNEERYVARVVAEARRYVPDILVVDDGSADETRWILQDIPDISVIRHGRNLGYGASLRHAFEHAIHMGYDWVITMDCDEQHEPSFVTKFIAASEAAEADIVSGSRYLRAFEDDSEPPADRRSINQRITRLLNQRLGLALTDAFCGFKSYRVAGLRRLRITVPGYEMPLQLWVQAARAGLRIIELPVRRIYNDATRHFGGGLDNPTTRYARYLEVLQAELAATQAARRAPGVPICQPC